MKHTYFTFFTFLILTISGNSQDSVMLKSLHYTVVVTPLHSKAFKGYLSNINDSSLTCSSVKTNHSLAPHAGKRDTVFSYADIDKLNIHFGNTATQVFVPAGIGLILGAVLGLADGDDNPDTWFALSAGEKALGLGLLGFGVGAIVGAIIVASTHEHFNISGNRQKFHEMYSIVHTKLNKGKNLSSN